MGLDHEMQVKAAEAGLRTIELPVLTRPRIGQSKISGTVSGTVRAAARMLTIIGQLALTRRRRVGHLTGVLSHSRAVVSPPVGTDAATRRCETTGAGVSKNPGNPRRRLHDTGAPAGRAKHPARTRGGLPG